MAVKTNKVATSNSKKEYKLPLFDILAAIDSKDFKYYENLDDETRKELNKSLVPLLRWVSATKNQDYHEYYTLLVNEFLNEDYFSLSSKHPELIWKLFCSVGTGRSQSHEWIPKKAGINKPKTTSFLENLYPMASRQEIELLKSQLNTTKLIDMGKRQGMPDNEIKEMTNEFKNEAS